MKPVFVRDNGALNGFTCYDAAFAHKLHYTAMQIPSRIFAKYYVVIGENYKNRKLRNALQGLVFITEQFTERN